MYPQRKQIRIKGYDYAKSGAYFITICIANRQNLLWDQCRGALWAPATGLPLSSIGKTVDEHIQNLNHIYPTVRVDKYCIMPDHIHMILMIESEGSGRLPSAPAIPRIINQFKGSITKHIGVPIWQKSYIDRVIRNNKGYQAVWEYIDNNPFQMDTADDLPNFSEM